MVKKATKQATTTSRPKKKGKTYATIDLNEEAINEELEEGVWQEEA